MASFYKTGVVHATPAISSSSYLLVDENNVSLLDEGSETLLDSYMDGYNLSHGFYEGFDIFSIGNNGTIMGNEFIEW